MAYSSILPYTYVYMDCEAKDLTSAISKCMSCDKDSSGLIRGLQNLWTSHTNPNPVIPCLSVRSGFDLFLKVMKFPPRSEIIMSAINIPSMPYIVQDHGLKVVPLDVNIEDVAPKPDKMEDLLTDKTVAILVSHLYGKMFDMEPTIQFAKKHKLFVIEDCAEAFCGFSHIGHPDSDISLFSFSVIKHYTSFGGAIAKVRDQDVFQKMLDLHNSYPAQTNGEYLKKVLKYSLVYIVLNCPSLIKPLVYTSRSLGIDHQKKVIKMLRGFPQDMMAKIRHRPSTALLDMMLERQSNFSMAEFCTRRLKGEYVHHRLPADIEVVGAGLEHNNYWLFPILVDNPDNFVKQLNSFGVDAYRGATQLNIIEPENGNSTMHPAASMNQRYPHEAKYLIDHVVYLPVNKTVPFHELDQLIKTIKMAVKLNKAQTDSHQVKLASKL
ncbi:uncharacterized protein LOC124271792 [Haliotis rubra]|uniref:uncharacterized protein LOC124271792 n=1 Tax=Haliotis rubra TaxID=36100 RepID=UPI001EE5EFC4|nr:uncharacterized protein LOC124271792 [Haliotis rubra]XP_046562902.1 uncharacterized protein LOC124271792 [Haliotis rubra]